MFKKHTATEHYLQTHDQAALQEAVEEAADTKRKWHDFLEGVVSVTRLITGPLFSLGGASLIAALTTQPIVPLALGVGLLVAATASLVTSVVSSYALHSLERAEEVQRTSLKDREHARTVVQEIRANGLCVSPQHEHEKSAGESGQVKAESCQQKKNWTQTIQTAELNEAAQRSIH